MHLGKRIKEVVDKIGMSYAEFGRRINTTPQNVNSIFKREMIHLDMLSKIGDILDHNFFKDLAEDTTEYKVSEPVAKYGEEWKGINTQIIVTLDGSKESLENALNQIHLVHSALK